MAYKDVNKLVLNLKTPKVTQEMLDDDVRSMFKNRKEGMDFINSQEWESDEGKQHAISRLDRVYPRIVRGSSPEYTERINSQYEGALPLLKEKGYPVDKWDMKGIENHIRDLFTNSNSDEEMQGLYKQGKHDLGNKIWDERYKPTFDALMIALDKYYNDDWQTNAPMGYEDETPDEEIARLMKIGTTGKLTPTQSKRLKQLQAKNVKKYGL